VAGDAIDRRVRSNQRESIFVSAYRLQGHIPADYAVALFAIRAELTAVNIGVAVRTVRAYVAEYGFGMALNAIYLCVHAPQWIAGRIVVKFRDCADRFPTRLCVAILAWDRERAVGAARLRIGYTTILSEGRSLDREHKRWQENERQCYLLEHERHMPLGCADEPAPKCFGAGKPSLQFMNHVWLQQLYEWAITYGCPTPVLN